MVGTLTQVAEEYLNSTSDPILTGIFVYETKDRPDVFDLSQFDGPAWKSSLYVLGCPGGQERVPSGRGRLFVEIVASPRSYIM